MLEVRPQKLDFANMSERQWRDLFKVRTAFHFETQPDTPAQSSKLCGNLFLPYRRVEIS